MRPSTVITPQFYTSRPYMPSTLQLIRGALGRARRLPRSGYSRVANRVRYRRIAKYLQYSHRIEGWTRGDEAVALALTAYALPVDAVLVEIGSFLGSGTILMAGARRARGNGIVHCVDPFDGSGDDFSRPYYNDITKTLALTQREQFERNIRDAGLSALVKVHPGTAATIGATWKEPIDMLFLDGDQSPTGARVSFDVWSPFLKVGGIIAVHNSADREYEADHDGNRRVAVEKIKLPEYDGARCIGSTTFATKRAASG
jgi:predicted O-methyltransferase YrrM